LRGGKQHRYLKGDEYVSVLVGILGNRRTNYTENGRENLIDEAAAK
jgi:hypothetical protein